MYGSTRNRIEVKTRQVGGIGGMGVEKQKQRYKEMEPQLARFPSTDPPKSSTRVAYNSAQIMLFLFMWYNNVECEHLFYTTNTEIYENIHSAQPIEPAQCVWILCWKMQSKTVFAHTHTRAHISLVLSSSAQLSCVLWHVYILCGFTPNKS